MVMYYSESRIRGKTRRTSATAFITALSTHGRYVLLSLPSLPPPPFLLSHPHTHPPFLPPSFRWPLTLRAPWVC